MTTDSIRVVADSPGRTAAVATALAGELRAGDAVLLHGGLAAGKTTFVQAVAAALGSPDPVTSPTFMLAQFYAGGRVPILHVDTYRLADAAEFRDLGLEEHLPGSVTLVEWGGLVADELPGHLDVTLETDPDVAGTRTITLRGHGPRWSAGLDRLRPGLLAAAA